MRDPVTTSGFQNGDAASVRVKVIQVNRAGFARVQLPDGKLLEIAATHLTAQTEAKALDAPPEIQAVLSPPVTKAVLSPKHTK